MTTHDFAIQAAMLNGTDAANILAGVTGVGGDYGQDIRSPHSDGTVHQTLHYIRRFAPGAQLSTRQLGTVLDMLDDSTDAPVKALDASNGLVMRAARHESNAPGYGSGTVHELITALRGAIFATGVQWSADGGASLDLGALFFSSDGDAAAIARSQGALASVLPTPEEAWDLASVTISTDAASGIDGIQDLTLGINAGMRQKWTTGKPYPVLVHGAGGGAGPVQVGLELTTTDRALERTFAAAGTTERTVTVVFKKYAQGGVLGSDTVTFTLSKCHVQSAGPIATQIGSPDAARLIVRPRYDGSTLPLSWAVA